MGDVFQSAQTGASRDRSSQGSPVVVKAELTKFVRRCQICSVILSCMLSAVVELIDPT